MKSISNFIQYLLLIFFFRSFNKNNQKFSISKISLNPKEKSSYHKLFWFLGKMDENFGKKVVKGTTGKFIKQYFTIKCQMNNQVMDLRKDEKNNDVVMNSGADGGKTQTFTFVREGYDFYIKNKS